MPSRKLAARILLAAIALVVLTVAGAAFSASPDDRAEFAGFLNRARATYRLAPMRQDANLDAVAQSWADRMAATGVMSHGDARSRTDSATRIWAVYPNTWAAENVAAGYPDTPSAERGWMASPGHRANMLGNYTIVGLGRAVSGRGVVYWTADFVRTGR